jgi:hypothetical protein
MGLRRRRQRERTGSESGFVLDFTGGNWQLDQGFPELGSLRLKK